MTHRLLKSLIVFSTILILASCNSGLNGESAKENLINKVNAVNDRWVNYRGISKNNKSMMQSQFIPYDSSKTYEVSHDTYVAYFNGEDFIKTELYEITPAIISTVEEADGIILSFNKENKSGMQLIEIE